MTQIAIIGMTLAVPAPPSVDDQRRRAPSPGMRQRGPSPIPARNGAALKDFSNDF